MTEATTVAEITNQKPATLLKAAEPKAIRHDSEKWLKFFLNNKQIAFMRKLREAAITAPIGTHASIDVGVVRRCCTNRHEPARCPPTGFLPADAIRHWSAEGGHPIQDLTAEGDLTPLPCWALGAKAIADDGLVAEERVLHPALTMVP